MLILILGALAVWLWFPAVPQEPGLLQRYRAWRTGEQTEADRGDKSADARVVRELSALLRSGLGFQQAVDALLETEKGHGEILEALAQLQATHRLNHQAAIAETASRQASSPAVQRLHWCLELSRRSGAGLAEVLERLAEDLEAALVAQQAFEAAMAGPKATTTLLSWLPLVGFGFGLLVGIDVLGAIATSWAAQMSVAVGAGLWAANRWWCQRLMRHISKKVLP